MERRRQLIIYLLILILGLGSLAYGESIDLKGVARDKNIIIVQINGLNQDFINAQYESEEILENINKLYADESMVFNNYYDLSLDTRGLSNQYISLNSIYPIKNLAIEKLKRQENLASLLGAKSYRNSLYLTREKGDVNDFIQQGFHFIKRDEQPLRLFREQLSKEDGEKFFAYINQDLDLSKGNYIEALKEVDRELGKLLEKLKEEELREETILLIQGGKSQLEDRTRDALVGHGIFPSYSIKNQKNIPLIINIPGLGRNLINRLTSSNLDLYPSLSYLLGVEVDSLGKNLLKSRSESALAILEENKYIYQGELLEYRGNLPLDRKTKIEETIEEVYQWQRKFIREDIVDLKELSLGELAQLLDGNYKTFRMDIGQIEKYGPGILARPATRLMVYSAEGDYTSLENWPSKDRIIVEIDREELREEVIRLGFDKIVFNENKALTSLENYKDYYGLILSKDKISREEIERHRKDSKLILVDRDLTMSQRYENLESDAYILGEKLALNNLDKKDILNKEIIAHAGGIAYGERDYPGKEYTYSNSWEAVENSYKSGIRLMEIDFHWTSDNKLISFHSWDGFLSLYFQKPVKRYSYDEFINFNMVEGWTQLYPEKIQELLLKYNDIYIVSDIKENNILGLKYLKENYPLLSHRLIPQVYNFQQYKEAEELGFKDIILTLYLMPNEEEDRIVEFAKEKRPFAVTMPVYRGKTDLARKLSQEGIYSYVHTLNSMEEIKSLDRQGIRGIYTDKIRP